MYIVGFFSPIVLLDCCMFFNKNMYWYIDRQMYFSQPDVSKYCADLMPLLLDYLSSLSEAKIVHVTKAFYALENFMENLGKLIYVVFK